MSCPICDWIDADRYVIYQDKFVVVFLHPEPVVEGHVVVVPRAHYAIMEQVPVDVLEHAFIVANRVSTSIFELLSAQGTNIIVNNGISAGQEVPHFLINIIPRKENDGLNFRWAPRQLTQQDFDSLTAKIKDKCDYIGHEKVPVAPVNLDEQKEINSDETDYKIKQLERIP